MGNASSLRLILHGKEGTWSPNSTPRSGDGYSLGVNGSVGEGRMIAMEVLKVVDSIGACMSGRTWVYRRCSGFSGENKRKSVCILLQQAYRTGRRDRKRKRR